MEIESKVKSLIALQIQKEPEEIHLNDVLLDDLGMDSLDCIELTMALEEEFNLEIPDDEVMQLITVEKIIEYIRDKKANN